MAKFTKPSEIKALISPSKVNKLNVVSVYKVEFKFSRSLVKHICVLNKFSPTFLIKFVIQVFTKTAE